MNHFSVPLHGVISLSSTSETPPRLMLHSFHLCLFKHSVREVRPQI